MLTTLSMAGENGPNTMWRVLNGEAPASFACPKLFQLYTVRHRAASKITATAAERHPIGSA